MASLRAIRRLVGVYFWLSEVGSKSSAGLRLDQGLLSACCRVSEIAAIKWGDIESLDDGGQIHLLGKGGKARTVRISGDTLAHLNDLAAAKIAALSFQAPEQEGTSQDKPSKMCAERGRTSWLPCPPTPTEA